MTILILVDWFGGFYIFVRFYFYHNLRASRYCPKSNPIRYSCLMPMQIANIQVNDTHFQITNCAK